MHKVARKSGAVWEFLWREGGKQKHMVVGPVKKYRTEAEAQRQVEHIRLRINANVPLPGIPTIGSVVRHYIGAEINATNPRLSYATRSINKVYLNTWILPQWEAQPLDTLLGVQVEKWLAGLDFAAGTKAKMRNLMSVIYAHAIRYGWIKHNPIGSVRQSAKRETIPDVLDAKELSAFMGRLSAMNTALVVLAMFTGLRSSELLALQWQDFDFEKLVFWVRRSIYHQQIGECKTEASRRPLPIDGFIKEAMLSWRKQSTYTGPGDWIFASVREKGRQPYWPENRRKAIKKAAAEYQACGISHFQTHALELAESERGGR
jgi:integrase